MLERLASIWTLLVVGAAACGSTNGTTGPGDGSGEIEVTFSTSGDDRDPDGYTVTMGDRSNRLLQSNGTTTFFNVPTGSQTLELTGIAPNCQVMGDNPRSVPVSAGKTAHVTFRVACTRFADILFKSFRTGSTHIWKMRSDGWNPTRVSHLTGQNFAARWSPDGTLIAFRSGNRTGVWLMDANGFEPIRISDASNVYGSPQWSPDGSRIAFTSLETSGTGGSFHIRVATVDGTDEITLVGDGDDSEPRWSPDGRQLAFRRTRTGGSEIWVMGAAGSDPTQLTDDPAPDSDPQWSPDGTKIAFVSRRTGNARIWVMGADGADPTNLTESPGDHHDQNPRWSPDGTKVAFERTPAASGEIWVIDADGSSPANLTKSPGWDWDPQWSPDSQWIAFVSDRTGDQEIWVVRVDGSDATNLTNDPSLDNEPRWRP